MSVYAEVCELVKPEGHFVLYVAGKRHPKDFKSKEDAYHFVEEDMRKNLSEIRGRISNYKSRRRKDLLLGIAVCLPAFLISHVPVSIIFAFVALLLNVAVIWIEFHFAKIYSETGKVGGAYKGHKPADILLDFYNKRLKDCSVPGFLQTFYFNHIILLVVFVVTFTLDTIGMI